jgi:hypothetical protein
MGEKELLKDAQMLRPAACFWVQLERLPRGEEMTR